MGLCFRHIKRSEQIGQNCEVRFTESFISTAEAAVSNWGITWHRVDEILTDRSVYMKMAIALILGCFIDIFSSKI